MADDLDQALVSKAPVSVRLENEDEASGLADMLHQYITQNIEESPKKCAQARRLRGSMAFQAAEDPEVCVLIRFDRERIALEDAKCLPKTMPSITADFISISYLTTGQESPFALIAKGKMKTRFSLRDVPFLLKALRFMRVPPEEPAQATTWLWLAGTAALLAIVALLYFVTQG